jgi:hypothetical protein
LIFASVIGRGREPLVLGVAVFVIDEYDVSSVAVEQCGGDRRAVAARAVDPQLAVRRNIGDAFGQLVQRDVDRTAYVAAIEFAPLTDIEHDDIAVAERIGQLLEVRDAVTAQVGPIGQGADVAAGVAGEAVNPDAGKFALRLGDLLGVADQRQGCTPGVQPAKVVDERAG